MSAPAFAPGPWVTDPERGHEMVLDANGVLVADCSIIHRRRTTSQCVAHAALMAAAPEMLTALRDATDALDYVHAIDSVTPPECDPDDGLCGAQFCAQNGCLVRKIAVARAALAKAQGAQS